MIDKVAAKERLMEYVADTARSVLAENVPSHQLDQYVSALSEAVTQIMLPKLLQLIESQGVYPLYESQGVYPLSIEKLDNISRELAEYIEESYHSENTIKKYVVTDKLYNLLKDLQIFDEIISYSLNNQNNRSENPTKDALRSVRASTVKGSKYRKKTPHTYNMYIDSDNSYAVYRGNTYFFVDHVRWRQTVRRKLSSHGYKKDEGLSRFVNIPDDAANSVSFQRDVYESYPTLTRTIEYNELARLIPMLKDFFVAYIQNNRDMITHDMVCCVLNFLVKPSTFAIITRSDGSTQRIFTIFRKNTVSYQYDIVDIPGEYFNFDTIEFLTFSEVLSSFSKPEKRHIFLMINNIMTNDHFSLRDEIFIQYYKSQPFIRYKDFIHSYDIVLEYSKSKQVAATYGFYDVFSYDIPMKTIIFHAIGENKIKQMYDWAIKKGSRVSFQHFFDAIFNAMKIKVFTGIAPEKKSVLSYWKNETIASYDIGGHGYGDSFYERMLSLIQDSKWLIILDNSDEHDYKIIENMLIFDYAVDIGVLKYKGIDMVLTDKIISNIEFLLNFLSSFKSVLYRLINAIISKVDHYLLQIPGYPDYFMGNEIINIMQIEKGIHRVAYEKAKDLLTHD